jgi:GntR family transcriptional repressor for pyruvate dehydrogenase complex
MTDSDRHSATNGARKPVKQARPASGNTRAAGVLSAFPTVRRSRFADQAYAFLFHKIITGEFREGQMLPPENEMCAKFGISRPVVREALDRLRSEGLVTSRRGLGSFVQPRPKGHPLTPKKLQLFEENMEFRRIIEPQAVMLACARRTASDLRAIRATIKEYERVAVQDGAAAANLDSSFHLAIAEASQNHRLVEAIRAVQYDIGHGIKLMQDMDRFDNLERCRKVLGEHSRILAAIEAKDAASGERAMRDHLERARDRLAKADDQN